MALTGSVTTNAYTYQGISRSVTLSWTATQNINSNTSTISWELKGDGSTAGSIYVSEIRITIDGVQAYYRDTSTHTNCYYGTLICSGTQTVYHDGDGNKTLNIKVEAGIYVWAINCAGEGTFALNTIPRPSSITAPPLTLGAGGTLTINSHSSAFTHDISYVFGPCSGVIATKTTASSVEWIPPLELANAIPNEAVGVGALSIDTYNGSTKLGTKTTTFAANVPASVVPTIGAFTDTKVNNSVPAEWDIYVQNKSQCELKILNAAGAYSSTIKSYSIKEGATVISSSATGTTAVLQKTGTVTYTATVTDSRGRTASKTVSIIVEAYTPPSILSTSSQRCLSDGTLNEDGTFIKCLATVELSSLDGKNTATQKVYFRKAGDEVWSTGTGFVSETPVIIAGAASTDYSYDVKYEVIDTFATAQVIAIVPTGYTTMDYRMGGKGVAVGKVSEKDAFECAMDAEFTGEVLIGGKSILDWTHPIGSVYRSSQSTEPSILFGGEWVQRKDEFFVAAGDIYQAGSTGGSRVHKHATQGHALTEQEIALHSHINTVYIKPPTSYPGGYDKIMAYGQPAGTPTFAISTSSVGGNQPHTHGDTELTTYDPPYRAYYCWERIA